MPDDNILRIGTSVDTGPLKAGMDEAVAIVRAGIEEIEQSYRQASLAVRKSVSGLGGKALEGQAGAIEASLGEIVAAYNSAAAEIQSSVAAIAAAQSRLGGLTRYDTPAVVAARERIRSQQPTSLIDTPERERLRQQIAEELYRPEGIAAERQAYLVMGPPASGKSGLAEPLATETRSLLIDADQAKAKLPEYAQGAGAGMVHEESAAIANQVRTRALESGLNIVQPIVGKNLDQLRALRDNLLARGYEVHLRLNDLPAEKAQQRAVSSFAETGRFVDPAYVASVGERPKQNYDILKSEGGFRTYEQYSADVPRGTPPRLVERIENSEPVRSLRPVGPGGGSGPEVSRRGYPPAEAEAAPPAAESVTSSRRGPSDEEIVQRELDRREKLNAGRLADEEAYQQRLSDLKAKQAAESNARELKDEESMRRKQLAQIKSDALEVWPPLDKGRIAENVEAQKVAVQEVAATKEQALERVATARKRVDELGNQPLSSRTIDADLELRKAEQDLARFRQTSEQETAIARTSAEQRKQVEEGLATAQKATIGDVLSAQQSAAGQRTASVQQAAESQQAASQAVAESERRATTEAQNEARRRERAERESVRQRIAANRNAANVGVETAQATAAAVEDATGREVHAAQTAEQAQAQSVYGRRTQLAILEAQHKKLAKEVQQAVARVVSAEEQAMQAQAQGHTQLAAVIQEQAEREREALTGLIAKQDQLTGAIQGTKNELVELGAVSQRTGHMFGGGWAKASLGAAELTGNVRGLAYSFSYLAMMSGAMDAIFPTMLAIGFAEAIVEVSKNIYDLYQNFVNLKDVEEQVTQIQIGLAKAAERDFAEAQNLAVAHLRALGQTVAAAQLAKQNLQSTPVDLQPFLTDETIKKKLKSLPDEMQKSLKAVFSDIVPSEVPAKIDELTKKMQAAQAAAKEIRSEQNTLETAPVVAYGHGAGGVILGRKVDALILEHKAKQQEVMSQLYGGLRQYLQQYQETFQGQTVKAQDAVNAAQAQKLMEGAEQQIASLKQQGRDSASAEAAIWRGVLAQLTVGTQAYREVQQKLGSLSKHDLKAHSDELRKADQDRLIDMRVAAAEQGKSQAALLAQEEAYLRSRLAVERRYTDAYRALREDLVRVEQEQMQQRIRAENQAPAGMVTSEGKPDFTKRLDYWNQVATDAVKGSEEYENAVQQAQRAGAEAIRATNDEVKQSVEAQFDTWVQASHRTDAEILKFWQDVKSRYASDAPLVEEALRKITEETQKLREETLRLNEIQAQQAENEQIGALESQKLNIRARYEIAPPASLNPFAKTPEQQEQEQLAQIDLQELQVKRNSLAQQLAAAKATYGNDETHYANLILKKEQLDQQYAQKKKQLDTQTIANELSQYRKFVEQIDSDFLRGMNEWIQGQKRFGQAMAETWNEIVMEAIRDIERIGMKWIEEHLIMAAIAKVLGVDTTGNDVQAAKTIQNNVREANSYAGLAAAEEFAYVLGETGNLFDAAAMGAAAYGIGEGFAATAALDTGGYIPRDGMAMLHQGEVVVNHPITQMLGRMAVTAKNPGAFQAGSASSHSLNHTLQTVARSSRGGDMHTHIHAPMSVTAGSTAMSSDDFKAHLGRHADHVGRLVNRQLRTFNR